MLSGECAMGKYPLECVKTMVKIAERTEPEINYWKRFDDKDKIILNNLEDNICYSTCVIAKNTNADAIVCYTHTGDSARRLAGMGAGCPILAVTDNKRTFRQLGLAWNVHPVYVEAGVDTDATVEAGIEKLKAKGILETGDKVVLSGGHSYINGVKSSKMIGGYLEI